MNVFVHWRVLWRWRGVCCFDMIRLTYLDLTCYFMYRSMYYFCMAIVYMCVFVFGVGILLCGGTWWNGPDLQLCQCRKATPINCFLMGFLFLMPFTVCLSPSSTSTFIMPFLLAQLLLQIGPSTVLSSPHVVQSYSEGAVKSPIVALADTVCPPGSTQPSVPGGCVVRGPSKPLSVEILDSLCLYPKFRLAF